MLLFLEGRFCLCSSCPQPLSSHLSLGAGSPLWERTSSGPRNSQVWTEITLASKKNMEN